jgi:signal transduction histidine kinase
MFLNWRGYLVAIGLVAFSTWLKYLAQPSIIPADVSTLYELAIVPTAIFFGLGPAILVCILSLLAYDYYFMPPLHQFNLFNIKNAPILLIFLLVGVLFSYLSSNLSKKNKIAAKEITVRKQSEAELAKYRDHLEDLVTKRTTELEKVNLDLKQDITERKQIEKDLAVYRDELEARVTERTAEIATMNERLQGLSRRLIKIQEEERGNIARELHDQIGQSLNIVKMLLDRATTKNGKDRQDLLDQARPQLNELIDRVVALSLDLRPKILDDLGLVRALEWYFDRFTTQTNIRVQFEPSNIEESLTVQIVNTVYRVVQEELTNVARHARATMVTIELKVERSTIQLFIGDDGIGFDPGALPASASVGIIGMQERINLLGGAMQIQSEPGAGTRLFAKIPCQIEDKEEE